MKSSFSFRVAMLLGTICLLAPALAHAHPGHGPAGDFGAGFVHPLTGLDHLLAMLAVSLWSVQLGSRAVWLLPMTFIGGMSLGSFFGSMPVPLIEYGMVGSLLVLGLLVAVGARLPLMRSVVLVGGFALLHGFAHTMEMAASGDRTLYDLGLIIVSALVLVAGALVARLAAQDERGRRLRWAGAAIALTGLMLSAA